MNRRLPPIITALALLAGAAGAEPVKFLGHQSDVPEHWVQEQPRSGMRALQYQVPGPEGAEPAELVVYYFGPGQGGSLEMNLERWRSQFTSPEGGPVAPAITELRGAALPATLVELEGRYARGVGIGQETEALPERMLLAAVVETPEGNLYPQLHGPADLVRGERDAFVAFVTGIRPEAAEGAEAENPAK